MGPDWEVDPGNDEASGIHGLSALLGVALLLLRPPRMSHHDGHPGMPCVVKWARHQAEPALDCAPWRLPHVPWLS